MLRRHNKWRLNTRLEAELSIFCRIPHVLDFAWTYKPYDRKYMYDLWCSYMTL